MAKTIGKLSRMEIFRYILLFLYFLSISAFRLGEGFDAAFVRVIFVIMLLAYIFQKKTAIISRAFLWIAVFWLFYFFSAFWAADVSDVFSNVPIAIQIIGLFLFLPSYIKDKKSMIIVLKILLYSLVITSLILLVRTPFEHFGTERLGEAIGLNANAFGIRMAIGATIALYLFHDKESCRKGERISYLFVAMMLLVFVLFSGSKNAFITAFIGLAGCEILLAKGAKAILRVVAVIIAAVGAIAIIFSNQQLYDVIGHRIEKTFFTVSGQAVGRTNVDRSLKEREFYMGQAWGLFTEHPLVGYGGNNFRTYMREINYSHVAYSHNNYTELLGTLGIIGFIIYYSFWVVAEFRLVKLYSVERKNNRRLSLYMLFSVMMAILLVLDYGTVSYVSEFSMVVLCLAYSCCQLKVGNNEIEKSTI